MAIPAGFTQVSLRTEDGLTLTAAWRRGLAGRQTIVFFHGNGDSFAGAVHATRLLSEAGYGIFLAEYRGYSGNPGVPNEAGLLADGRAALAFLHAQGMVQSSLVMAGASLGTGIATQLAAEDAPAALILVSPFTSLADVAAIKLPFVPVRYLIRDHFDSLGAISKVAVPILILHACDDAVIPFRQGQALAGAANRVEFAASAGHGHQLQFGEQAQLAWLNRLSQ